MDRRYSRKYENFDTIVPRVEDFPVLNSNNQINNENEQKSVNSMIEGLKTDDIVLLTVLVILLMEEEKDFSAILSIGALLFAGYIF